MAIEITCRFTTETGEYPGAYASDYFVQGGLRRAAAMSTPSSADALLRETYKGSDADGVGLTWAISKAA